MVRNVLGCLILIFALAGCGQVNINIEPKSDSLPSVVPTLKTSTFEVTTGSTLKKVTSAGYTVTASTGDSHTQSFQQTAAGYKVYVGVTGIIMYNQ